MTRNRHRTFGGLLSAQHIERQHVAVCIYGSGLCSRLSENGRLSAPRAEQIRHHSSPPQPLRTTRWVELRSKERGGKTRTIASRRVMWRSIQQFTHQSIQPIFLQPHTYSSSHFQTSTVPLTSHHLTQLDPKQSNPKLFDSNNVLPHRHSYTKTSTSTDNSASQRLIRTALTQTKSRDRDGLSRSMYLRRERKWRTSSLRQQGLSFSMVPLGTRWCHTRASWRLSMPAMPATPTRGCARQLHSTSTRTFIPTVPQSRQHAAETSCTKSARGTGHRCQEGAVGTQEVTEMYSDGVRTHGSQCI